MNARDTETVFWGFLSGLLLALVLSLTVGCSPKPEVQYAQVNDTFIATTQALIEAREDGRFDAETWEDDILPLIEVGDILLDEYHAAVAADLPTDSVLERIRRVLGKLEPYLTRALE